MDPRQLAQQFAFGRMGLGGALLAFPGVIGGLWIGRSTASRPGARVILRALGIRDLALGLGLKAALDRDAPTRGWLEAGLAADGVDLVSTLLAGDDLPLAGRLTVGAAASNGVALGAWLLRSAEVGAAAPEIPEREPERAGAASLASP